MNLSNLGVAMTPLPIMPKGNLRGLSLGSRGLETGITMTQLLERHFLNSSL